MITSYSEVIEPKENIKAVSEDSKDDMVLECALASNASFIVTGDNHLLKLKEFRGIKIITPKDFLSLINEDK